MIEAVYNYFRQCPLIEDKRLSVDYLGDKTIEYTIDVPPYDALVRQYADGGAVKQFVFDFGSRDYYGADVMQNIENSGFYNQMEEWITEQNKIGNLPDLGENKVAQGIYIDTPGYLFNNTADTARYQIQMRLVYYQAF